MAIILVVDDDPALFRMVRALMHMKGHIALSAPNGYEAHEILRDRRPDLILLDVQMPVIGGESFFKQIEQRMGRRRPPVIFLSAFGAESAQERLGAEAALDKPFDPEVLEGEIERLIAEA